MSCQAFPRNQTTLCGRSIVETQQVEDGSFKGYCGLHAKRTVQFLRQQIRQLENGLQQFEENRARLASTEKECVDEYQQAKEAFEFSERWMASAKPVENLKKLRLKENTARLLEEKGLEAQKIAQRHAEENRIIHEQWAQQAAQRFQESQERAREAQAWAEEHRLEVINLSRAHRESEERALNRERERERERAREAQAWENLRAGQEAERQHRQSGELWTREVQEAQAWATGVRLGISTSQPQQRPTVFPKAIPPEKECSICFSTESRVILGCQHTVCTTCVRKINTCPICRHDIQFDLVRSL